MYFSVGEASESDSNGAATNTPVDEEAPELVRVDDVATDCSAAGKVKVAAARAGSEAAAPPASACAFATRDESARTAKSIPEADTQRSIRFFNLTTMDSSRECDVRTACCRYAESIRQEVGTIPHLYGRLR